MLATPAPYSAAVRLEAVHILLNGAKCDFGQRSMDFLGHRVSEAGIAHTSGRIEAIKQTSVRQRGRSCGRFWECATTSGIQS